MKNSFLGIGITGILLLMVITPVFATPAHYDLAIFAYEEKRMDEAEAYARKAHETDPDNPHYQHLLGQIQLALGRLSDAESLFERAWQTDPTIIGLAFDRAYLKYLQGEYEAAVEQFTTLVDTDHFNAQIHYIGGLSLVESGDCKTASKWLSKAVLLSPGLKENIRRHLTRCRDAQVLEIAPDILKTTDSTDASAPDALIPRENNGRPLLLYFRTSVGYDSNVPLDPIDREVYSDQSDVLAESLLWGRYHLLNQKKYKAGFGLRAYQSLYPQLNEFNLSALSPTAYGQWHHQRAIFQLSYYPSWFWFDGEDYLLRHNIVPELLYHANPRLQGRLRYHYQDNDYIDDNEHDGDRHGIELEAQYNIGSRKGHLFGGVGIVDLSAASADLGYQGMGLHAGVAINLPWQLTLRLEGRYDNRSYDETDIYFFKDREDDKYTANLRLKRRLFYDWLEIEGEGEYTHNDSNIDEYAFRRMVTKLSLILRY